MMREPDYRPMAYLWREAFIFLGTWNIGRFIAFLLHQGPLGETFIVLAAVFLVTIWRIHIYEKEE